MSIDINLVSRNNANFWDEPCGSQLAHFLGVKDASPASLKRFDDWYMNFYPYLSKLIEFGGMRESKVLEVGLGYGTVAQRLAESGAKYTGLDIARGPVKLVRHRLGQIGINANVLQGNILSAPFANETFDSIVAIGCLHHTGDLKKAIDECFRILRPGGRLVFMVYYSYSYRRWVNDPIMSFQYFFWELLGFRGVVGGGVRQRAAYDVNSKSEVAPHTDWISKRSMANLCRDFKSCEMSLQNIDEGAPFRGKKRNDLLNTKWPARIGLDLYVAANK